MTASLVSIVDPAQVVIAFMLKLTMPSFPAVLASTAIRYASGRLGEMGLTSGADGTGTIKSLTSFYNPAHG